MARTFYTIDDLYKFCKENNFSRFNAKENGNKPLILQSIETFEVCEDSNDGLLPVKLKSCHIGVNRNGSSIDKSTMEKYKHTFKGRPILGAIYLTDTGEYEFRSHDMEISDDGNVKYIEQPVGVISQVSEPYLEYYSDTDKTYLIVEGNIFEDYTEAANIMRRRKTCKCSVEIAVNDISWSLEQDCLSINDFSFRGVTILGYTQDGVTEIPEGMEGSKITIEDFGEKNSMFSQDYQNKLLDALDKLNTTLSTFQNKDFNQKGVNEEMNKLEALMEEYEVTMDDIEFEVDGLTDEELEAAFEENFKCKKKKYDDGEEAEQADGDEGNEGGGDEDEEPDPGDDEEDEEEDKEPEADDGTSKSKKKYSVDDEGNVTLSWEISHGDVYNALYSLLRAENDCWSWIADVYDSYFIYQFDVDGKYYKRGYSVNGEDVSIDENKVEVFTEWLTQDEKDAIAKLKSDYAALKEFKDKYDADEIKSQKDAIFDREEYAVLNDDEAFTELKKNADKYSVAEIEEKAKVVFADYVMQKGQFALEHKDEKKSIKKVGVNFSKPTKKNPYGSLFDK